MKHAHPILQEIGWQSKGISRKVCAEACLACIVGTTFAFFKDIISITTNGIEIEFPVQNVHIDVKFPHTDKQVYRVGNINMWQTTDKPITIIFSIILRL